MLPTLTKVAGKELRLSNLDKSLYPNGFTKAQVIDYYMKIAPAMLPHLKDRAITLKRYPNGSMGMHFFEKQCPSHRPDWVKTGHVRSNSDEGNWHCLVNDRATLAWVANLAALELHVPLALAHDPFNPRVMVFDLDPGPGVTIIDCAKLAIQMRDVLADQGLKSFAKTSGGKGFHFYVPLNTQHTFDQTKTFARMIAQFFGRHDPKRVTANMSKAERAGKIFIDWSQNDEHKTTVCVYSLRARETPSVSTPVTWKEVESAIKKDNPDLLHFQAEDVVKRVAKSGDLFKDVLKKKQKLPEL